MKRIKKDMCVRLITAIFWNFFLLIRYKMREKDSSMPTKKYNKIQFCLKEIYSIENNRRVTNYDN